MIPLVLTALVNLTLGLFVLRRAPKRAVNRRFAALSGALSSWTLSNALVSEYADNASGLLWARFAFASAALIPVAFLRFVTVFPSPTLRPPDHPLRWFTAAGLAAFFLSFTPLIAQATSSVDGVLRVTYGPLHLPFGAYLVACLCYSLWLLATKLRLSRGLERLQVKYVFYGILLTAFAGTLTNLIIPAVLKSSRFSPYGPVFTLLMVAFIAHSIVRHRLMAIRFVLRRGAVYALSLAIVAIVFLSLAWLTSLGFVPHPFQLPLSAQSALVLLLALVFPPLKIKVQAALDRYFFRGEVNYENVLREITHAVTTTLDAESVLQLSCHVIRRTLHPEYVAIYIVDGPNDSLTLRWTESSIELVSTQLPSLIQCSHPLPQAFSGDCSRLLREDPSGTSPFNTEITSALVDLGAELALPIRQEARLIGLFLLGPKLSGDPYYPEEIDLLTTLAGQVGIAVNHARLYSEIVLANEYVENILATMNSGVVAISAAGTVSLSNSAAEALIDASPPSLKGRPLAELPSSISTPLALTLADGQPRTQFETTLVDREKNLRPLVCSTSPLRDRNGDLLGAVAVFSDLTHIKRLEEEKRQAERLASVGALASGIAHEIKNPLVAIKTFAELLPERFGDVEFRTEFAHVVTTEIDRIDGLVARLRGLATPAQPKATLLDVRVPIDETLALLKAQLEQHQIAVKTVWPPHVPSIAGDPAQLKQLFLNLFINSIEAMAPGGQLVVQVIPRRMSGSALLIVEVSDTGSGIPAPLLGKIFDPFVTTKPRGSGLGLSICRNIADAHRATIHAENNADQGTTIVIQFPVVEALNSTQNNSSQKP